MFVLIVVICVYYKTIATSIYLYQILNIFKLHESHIRKKQVVFNNSNLKNKFPLIA